MRNTRTIFGFVPILLMGAPVRGANVDVVVTGSVHDTHGNGDGAFTHTHAGLTARANVYRSDDPSPVIRLTAWLWRLPEGFDPFGTLQVIKEGAGPEEQVFAWADAEQRERLLREGEARASEFPPVVSAPGILSRWERDAAGEWRLAAESRLRKSTVLVRPRLERWDGEEAAASTSLSLPTVAIPAGESRVVRVGAARGEGFAAGPVFLELRSTYDWGDRPPPRLRRRDYTGSWLDRMDMGGRLEIEGVYTEGLDAR